MRVIDAEQRSAEWFAARAGKLTGSRAADFLAKGRNGAESVVRRDLKMQLAAEILTGRSLDCDGFVSKEMQRGIDLEPAALAAYEALSGNVVRKTGFIVHDSLPFGCSLDGDIDGFDGILELKCPKIATHVGYLKAGKLPAEYVPQITHNLWITGAKWADFASFDDRLPDPLQLFVVRVQRDEKAIEEYAAAAADFMIEVETEAKALTAMILAKAA